MRSAAPVSDAQIWNRSPSLLKTLPPCSILEQEPSSIIPRGVRFADDDELVLSTIYDWFDEDFGGNEAGVLAHIKQFANPELRKQLDAFDGDIEYEYEWRLNGTPDENCKSSACSLRMQNTNRERNMQ